MSVAVVTLVAGGVLFAAALHWLDLVARTRDLLTFFKAQADQLRDPSLSDDQKEKAARAGAIGALSRGAVLIALVILTLFIASLPAILAVVASVTTQEEIEAAFWHPVVVVLCTVFGVLAIMWPKLRASR